MNKAGIKSAVSIEFGLSIKEAGRVVDIIFDVLADFFKKNKTFEIRKFGKIDAITAKENKGKKIQLLNFTPSKKLARRVNYNFENLKKVKLQTKEKNEIPIDDKLDYKISDEFLKQLQENKDDVIEIIFEDTFEPVSISRTLISDKTIKLHKDITDNEKDNTGKTNLWG